MTAITQVRFGTTLNCMDGRAVEPTIRWMKETFDLHHIDTITEPGMNAFIGKMDLAARAWLKKKLEISIMHHGSRVVTIGGHEDCAGNPVSEERHKEDVTKSVAVVKALIAEFAPEIPVKIVGLYIAFPAKGTLSCQVQQV